MHRTCVAHSTLSIIPLCSRSSDSGSGSGNALPGVGLPRRRHVASQTQQRCSVSQVVGLRAPREIESQTDEHNAPAPSPHPTPSQRTVALPATIAADTVCRSPTNRFNIVTAHGRMPAMRAKVRRHCPTRDMAGRTGW